MSKKCDRTLIIVEIVLLLLCVFFIVGLLVIHSNIEHQKFTDMEQATLFKAISALFIVVYFVATVFIVVRSCLVKRICGIPFAVYMAGSILLVIMLGALSAEIIEWEWTHGDDPLNE